MPSEQIILSAFLIFLAWISWYFFYKNFRKKQRKEADFERSMDLVFLNLSFPIKDSKEDKEKDAESIWWNSGFKEYTDVMSQLYDSIYSIYKDRKDYEWEDFISLEMAIIDKKLHFYMVIPRDARILIEKKLSSFYPDIFIDDVKDYNIFKENSKVACKTYLFKKEEYFPIKTYDKMSADPLNTIVNWLSKFEEDEWVAIQFLIRPVKEWWQEDWKKKSEDLWKWKKDEEKSFLRFFNPINWIKWFFFLLLNDKPKEDKEDEWWKLTQWEQEIVNLLEEKIWKNWFEVILRIITSAEDEDWAEANMEIISQSFNQYTDPWMNSFEELEDQNTENTIFNYWMRNFSFDDENFFWGEKKLMIFSPKELASVFHFPNIKFNKSTVIKWQEFKIAPAPSELPTEWILLWINSYRWQDREIRISRDDRRRHFYIIWKSWTWKSALLTTLAKQDLANWDWLCIIDPHGDLVEDILEFVPRHRADDVIVFDPWDLERPMWLNILEAEWDDKKEFVSQEALWIFIKLYWEEIMWPRLQTYFRNWVLTLMADDEAGATILDLMRLYTDEPYQKHKVSFLKNPEVRSFWEKEMANTWDREKAEIIPYFAAKFWPFKTNAQIRNIIWQPKSWFDFRDVMDNQRILLVNLSKWKLWDLNAKLLWMIMVSKIQMAAMSRADTEEHLRKDFYLYVDEFQNFITESFESILSEARKYRLWLIIAHQYISQLTKMNWKEDHVVKDAVFWNVWSMMNFKIWAADWAEMEKEFEPVFTAQDLVNIANYNAYIKLNINWTTSRWFSMKTIFDKSWADKDWAKAFKQLSRLKNARKREFVEKEITRRIEG